MPKAIKLHDKVMLLSEVEDLRRAVQFDAEGVKEIGGGVKSKQVLGVAEALESYVDRLRRIERLIGAL